MKKYNLDCLVIGSGCAGFNACDWLHDLNIRNIMLVTEGIRMGTSRNTGSDKQTYYKMALSSDCIDGVGKMAESYFDGGAMDGDLALSESANSLECFFKLHSLKVPFPQNDFGEFLGYRTDHDDTKRATSAGPLTSKYMTEALEKSVNSKGIFVLDNTVVFKILASENKVLGAIGFDKVNKDFILFNTKNIILATGGCAYLYRDSVFPPSQTGMSGMAIEAGAGTTNFCEWQYGLASIDFRWNVSGTYQQVLPRYISIDENGNEREFLNESLSLEDVLLYTFKKGYQWPFDSKKAKESSTVDMLVHAEILKGNKVYMDFRNNPIGFDVENLPEEAYTYLKNSDALKKTPVERLIAMNKKAYSLYLDHCIDLKKDLLRVAVCAQHQNGGISVDKNYQTEISGLYVAGEAAGVFGIYRPGGSALNSTQVSSMRSAKHIASKEKEPFVDTEKQAEEFLKNIKIDHTTDFCISEKIKSLQGDLSDYGAFLRNEEKIAELCDYVKKELSQIFEHSVKKEDLTAFLKYRDMLISANEFLISTALWCKEIGSRGGAMCKGKEPSDSKMMIKTKGHTAFLEEAKPIPESEVWFERVYNK